MITISSIGNQIDESTFRNTIVFLDRSDLEQGVEDYLKELSVDSVETSDVTEYWGTDLSEDGEDMAWRIHVRHS